MGGLGTILLFVVLESAAAPQAVGSEIERALSALGLPEALAQSLTAPVVVRWHDRDAWSRAWYGNTDPRGGGAVHLARGHYSRGLALRPVDELTVDDAEYLFRALLGARLETAVLRRDALGAELVSRSAVLRSAPAALRIEAYVDAQASFGSHLVSLLTEIARKERQRRLLGKSLCPALGRDVPLFRLWGVAFGGGAFPGSYAMSLGEMVVTRSTSEILSAEDRRWFVEEVLGMPWTGDPELDLSPVLCSPGSATDRISASSLHRSPRRRGGGAADACGG